MANVLYIFTLITMSQASYEILTCRECSMQQNKYRKICNLADKIEQYFPNANKFAGACCSADDDSQYCKDEQNGGVSGNKCSMSMDTANNPLWYAFCPAPESVSNCQKQKLSALSDYNYIKSSKLQDTAF